MKKIWFIFLLIACLLFTNLFAEPIFSEPTQNTNVRYRLFPTQNTWNFLKLDTITGRIWQVQWSMEPDDRFVIPIP